MEKMPQWENWRLINTKTKQSSLVSSPWFFVLNSRSLHRFNGVPLGEQFRVERLAKIAAKKQRLSAVSDTVVAIFRDIGRHSPCNSFSRRVANPLLTPEIQVTQLLYHFPFPVSVAAVY